MPNTAHGLFYPSPTAVPDVPTDMQALATSIEDLLVDYYPSCSMNLGSAQATVSGSPGVVQWDTEVWDSGMHDGSFPSRITAPIDGIYEVVAQISWSSNATGYREANINRNGTTYLRSRGAAISGATSIVTVSGLVDMTAGQYLEVEATQNSGSALSLVSGTWTRCHVRRVGDLV